MMGYPRYVDIVLVHKPSVVDLECWNAMLFSSVLAGVLPTLIGMNLIVGICTFNRVYFTSIVCGSSTGPRTAQSIISLS